MKKNGFTLIELLAVIIVLAIVALIATPIVLNVVDDAKASAAESEANLVLSGISNYCATEQLKKEMNSSYIVKCTDGTLSSTNVAAMVTTDATVSATVAGYKVTALTVTSKDGKYVYTLSGNAMTSVSK